MLLYRFDNVEDFPVLESETTARERVRLCLEGAGNDTHLHVIVKPEKGIYSVADSDADIDVQDGFNEGLETSEQAGGAVVLALPLLAVDGNPEKFELEASASVGRCDIIAEAGDALGWGFAYSFGRVGVGGRQVHTVNAQQPNEFWGDRDDEDTSRIIPPIQLFRLRLVVREPSRPLGIDLRALVVTGDVHLVRPGLAGGMHRRSD